MSSAVMSARRPTANARGAAVRHLDDHSALYAPWPSLPLATERSRRDIPDALVVPATRRAHAMGSLIDLAADLGSELVVLCSGQTSVDQVAERMHRQIGARGVVASVKGMPSPAGAATSGQEFSIANGGRRSDLSTKRNIGLQLARLRGWKKLVFVDDDISLKSMDVPRLVRQLDRYPIVGMRCAEFPDNSVLCHARRLAKLRQSVFVTGAVLGVNCEAPLGFFPDVYNEDWFFFGEAAAARRLPKPLHARQARYDPYATPDRARHEEFGDLLAEGLYALVESSGLASFEEVAGHANATFWESFIEVRLDTIDTVHKRLTSFMGEPDHGADVMAAVAALEAARGAYDRPAAAITAATCVDFLEGWRDDTASWHSTPRRGTFRSTGEALTALGAQKVVPVRLLSS